jgi:hypothetical protein
MPQTVLFYPLYLLATFAAGYWLGSELGRKGVSVPAVVVIANGTRFKPTDMR